MFQIDLKSRKAIYAQIVDHFKLLVTTGVLKQDEKVPSVRDLAKVLTVNPNTIQKAYRELENQNYFYTVLGQGSFIASPPESVNKAEVQDKYTKLKTTVHELMFLGETKEEIVTFINADCTIFEKQM